MFNVHIIIKMVLVYSCCFWFSLRLGGIIIGFLSLVQAIIILIPFCVAYNEPQNVKDRISLWWKDMNFIYINAYLESLQIDPEKIIQYSIVAIYIYIFFSVLYIYGAYICNNAAMVGFILIELVRLVTLTIIVIKWLLVLKENTMDIGLLIGASVAAGFILLALFYLWLCAANLPLLINEMACDELTATVKKLQQLLDNKDQRNSGLLKSTSEHDSEEFYRRQLFVIPRNEFRQQVQ